MSDQSDPKSRAVVTLARFFSDTHCSGHSTPSPTARDAAPGYGRTEDVAGAVIVLVIFFSACVAAYESIQKLVHPVAMTHLWWVAGAAVVGFLGNELVAEFRIRVGQEISSAALVADGQHSRVDGFTSLAVLIGVVGTWAGYPILDPLVGVLITIAILFIVRDAATAVFRRMLDGIEPEVLDEVEHAAMHVEGVQRVDRVRARWIGHKIHTDLSVEVDPSLSVTEANSIAEEVEHEIGHHLSAFGGAVVRVRPATELVLPPSPA